jgi:flagellar biosynthesis protein FlhG
MTNGTSWSLARWGSRLRQAGDLARPPAKKLARVLSIASGKGGTGKSVVATNLAVLRAQRGERVCLIDFDAGMANAHLLLGVAPRFDLGHVLDGDITAGYALVEAAGGLRLLSGGVGRSALANPTRKELEKLFTALEPLEEAFDLVIVDHGAGLSYATMAHLAAASTLMVVTTHEVTSLSDAYALYKHVSTVNPRVQVGLVMNRAPDAATALAAWERFRGASQRFLTRAPELVGWVPHDEAVVRSVQARAPVALREPQSPAARALDKVASWPAIESARVVGAFYDAARRALR